MVEPGGVLEEFGTLGHPGRLGFCVAEHPANTEWAPFHTQFGLAPADSAVTIMATEGPNSVNNHYADSGVKVPLRDDRRPHRALRLDELLLARLRQPESARGTSPCFLPNTWPCVGEGLSATRRGASVRAQRPLDGRARALWPASPAESRPEFRVELGAPRGPVGLEEQLTFVESGCAGGRFSAVILRRGPETTPSRGRSDSRTRLPAPGMRRRLVKRW